MTDTAGHDKATDDGVSRAYSLNVGRYGLNHPRNLMAEDTWQREFHLALDDVQVGMADATGGYSHQDLTRFGLGCGDFFDDEVPPNLRQDYSFH
jgi:hypothetical protein